MQNGRECKCIFRNFYPCKKLMFRLLRRERFSTKLAINAHYKSFLSKYKESLNQILSTGNVSASLEKIGVTLAKNKKDASLNELGTINIIDSQKAELTTFDPQVNHKICYMIIYFLS